MKIYLLSVFGFLAACSQTEEINYNVNQQNVDLSGYWEKNYQRSDDIDSKFRLFLFDIQRIINGNANRGIGQGPGVSNETLVGLARITEDITGVVQLEIEQDENSIRIAREDNFALSCDYFQESFVRSENAFGSEACGWYGDQLIFQMSMQGGLGVYHQITLSPNHLELNVTTTVSSSSVSTPFIVSSYYRKYTPPEENFDCIFTISRNNVCTQSDL